MRIMCRNSERGFTLMELLIVVAIIAVLVAIAIPVFGSSLEKAKEATDLANIRSAYAEVSVGAVTEDGPDSKTVILEQSKAGWVMEDAAETLNNLTKGHVIGAPADGGGKAVVEWLADEKCVQITFDGSGGGGSGTGIPDANGNYIADRSNIKSIVVGVAAAAFDFISGLDADELASTKAWLLAGTCGEPGNDSNQVPYRAMQLDTMKTRAMYEKPAYNRHSWLDAYDGTDINSDILSKDAAGYMSEVYFDLDTGKPIAAGYYENGSSSDPYYIVYLDDNGRPTDTIKMQEPGSQWKTSAGYRYYYAYNKDYGLEHGTVIAD